MQCQALMHIDSMLFFSISRLTSCFSGSGQCNAVFTIVSAAWTISLRRGWSFITRLITATPCSANESGPAGTSCCAMVCSALQVRIAVDGSFRCLLCSASIRLMSLAVQDLSSIFCFNSWRPASIELSSLGAIAGEPEERHSALLRVTSTLWDASPALLTAMP